MYTFVYTLLSNIFTVFFRSPLVRSARLFVPLFLLSCLCLCLAIIAGGVVGGGGGGGVGHDFCCGDVILFIVVVLDVRRATAFKSGCHFVCQSCSCIASATTTRRTIAFTIVVCVIIWFVLFFFLTCDQTRRANVPDCSITIVRSVLVFLLYDHNMKSDRREEWLPSVRPFVLVSLCDPLVVSYLFCATNITSTIAVNIVAVQSSVLFSFVSGLVSFSLLLPPLPLVSPLKIFEKPDGNWNSQKSPGGNRSLKEVALRQSTTHRSRIAAIDRLDGVLICMFTYVHVYVVCCMFLCFLLP